MRLKTSMLLAALLAACAPQAFAAEGEVLVSGAEKKPDAVYHKIVPRDTLWDISGKYLENPFKWPKLWKINPYIRNPHLIYPGNIVKITPEGIEVLDPDAAKADALTTVTLEPGEKVVVMEPEAAPEPAAAPAEPARGPSHGDHAISRSGFISYAELKASGAVVGSREKKNYMHEGDDVFATFKDRDGVKEGDRFTVFLAGREIEHPVTGRRLGHEIEILGSLTVRKAAGVFEAEIDDSYREIPEGARLKPYAEPVREVEITAPGSEVTGYIVTGLEGKENLSAGDITYLDKGSADGLRKGNVMRIYRPLPDAGDPMRSGRSVALPPAELGTLVVLDAGEKTSTAIVLKSVKTINWGDRVSTVK